MQGGPTTEASTPTGAVFLSYASEDAESAERIATALRAAGVEVWFDREELRGGDAWDQKIRQQILDCRLFVPIISANTETRLEGYFRREWKLATDRTESMASELAFLFPVVIDGTSNTSAHVPEKFRHIQWTRLASGQVPPAFVERVRRLLSPDASFPQAATWVRRGSSSSSIPTSPVRRSWRSNPLWWVAGVGIVVLLGYIAVVSRHSIVPTSPATPAAQTAPRPDNSVGLNPPPHSIAVLPFVNMSGDKEQEYFSDGLSEELIDMLTKVPDLRVPARTSSFYFKGKSEDIGTIAQRLHVANVLEGSVRKSGNALRVTAQLIRADNGYHLWSETYDRELKDVFKVQDDIAGAVVTALKVHLLPTQSAAPAAPRTENTEAYNLYLQGRESFNRGDAEGYQRAVTALSAATALDPHYAAAYAALALAQYWRGDLTSDEADYKSALESASKAVALAPELGVGYAARGFVRAAYSFDFAGAMADLDEAVALSPHDAEVLHRSAVVLAIYGNLPAAIAREKEAVERDPLSAEICMRLGFFYSANQQLAEARSMYEKALAIAPNSFRARYNLARLDLMENRPEQALAAFREIKTKEWSLSGQAMAEYSLGHADASQRFLNQLIDTDDATGVAQVYAWRGENDHAFEWLERAYAQRQPPITWIKILPEYRGLRSDARYMALLRKMNLAE